MDKNDWNKTYHNSFTPWRESNPDIETLIEISGITSGNALDLGCGTGEWGIALANKGFEVEGLDFSDEALEIARSQSNKVTFVEWDLENLVDYPFKHETYDLVIDQKVLAFIKDKKKYLDTVKNILKGVYYLTVFHEHDEKPVICVPQSDFERLVLSRFDIMSKKAFNPRPGKIIGVYYLK